jgi:hypothetical protein
VINSVDDDPARVREFEEFKKAISQMSTGSATVGGILGAMVYQIGQVKEQRHKDALQATKPQSHVSGSKKGGSGPSSRGTTHQPGSSGAEAEALDPLFADVLESLNIDYSIKETDFKHVFSPDKVLDDKKAMASPYVSVKNENDRLLTGEEVWRLPDGRAQGHLEAATLECQKVPGVNQRHCMPAAATKRQAVREADQDAIVQFCSLPPPQTKRCLILKAFERMMLKQQPEQSFHFLDRNFVEEFKDRSTMRQVLAEAMTQMMPDTVTEYYEMLDGLLVAMYHKNPPGRLIRD